MRLRSVLLATLAIACPAVARAQSAMWRSMSNVRNECRPAIADLTWQWNRYAGRGALTRQHPLFAFTNAANPQGLEDLLSGVSQNPPVVQKYRACAGATSVMYLMYVAATASPRQCDMAELSADLTWQKNNALASLQEALRFWRQGRAAKTVAEEDAGVLRAVGHLYDGVRFNAPVVEKYRACFRDRPQDLFEQVRLILGS